MLRRPAPAPSRPRRPAPRPASACAAAWRSSRRRSGERPASSSTDTMANTAALPTSPRPSRDAAAAASAPPPNISSTKVPVTTSAPSSSRPATSQRTRGGHAEILPELTAPWRRNHRQRRSRSRSAVPPRRSAASPGRGSCAPPPARGAHRRPARPIPAPRRPRSSSRCPRGTAGHARMPTTDGFTACHTSTYGWPVTSTSGPATAWAARVSLVPVDEVVDQDPQPPVRRRAEVRDDGGEVVHAVHRLDDDSLDPQVVAPHGLHQRGVVDALDPDRGWPGRCARVRFATFTEPEADSRVPAGCAAGGDQGRGAAVDQERGGPQREHPVAAVPVLQGHLAHVRPHHGAAEPARRVLDDGAALGGDLRDLLAADRPAPRRRRTRPGSRGSGAASPAGPRRLRSPATGRTRSGRAARHRPVLPRPPGTPRATRRRRRAPRPVPRRDQELRTVVAVTRTVGVPPVRPLASLTPCPAPPRRSPCGPRPGWPVPRPPTTCSTRSGRGGRRTTSSRPTPAPR